MSDYNEIHRRQTMVRSLVQDEVLFNKLREHYHSVALGEDALLAYWNPASQEENHAHAKVMSLYYNLYAWC